MLVPLPQNWAAMREQVRATEIQRAGVIGYPLRHSVSPALQQAAFDRLGLPTRYELWETPPEALRRRIEGLRRPNILGANITVPYKEAVLQFLDERDDLAGRIGAVNTIVNREGRLLGYNTDAPGFVRALKEDGGLDPIGKRALLLGAGGAARAVAFALLSAGVACLVISNRTLNRTEALAESLRSDGAAGGDQGKVRVASWGVAPGDVDLIVNTTSIGMRHSADEGQSPLDASQIPPQALLFDLVYNPSETPLVAAARMAGGRTIGGLSMLVYQGAISFEIWTGRQPPLDVMLEAARKALE